MGEHPAVYAIRYATRDESYRGEHFYRGDPHGDERMPIDYFVWVIVGAEKTILFDTGFTSATAAKRGNRRFLQSPIDSLAALGITATEVSDVVISHLHYDHTGNLPAFESARMWLQRDEYEFWASPIAQRGEYPNIVEDDDILWVRESVASGRISLLDGDADIGEGVRAPRLGGHTAGLQFLSVMTEHGTVVLASDASHFYENIREDRPYSLVDHLPSMYQAFDTAHELATSPDLVVPGHDPEVMKRFPAVPKLEGLVVRIA
jgi:glyoxylase-like metal-dependent hydrolase (beta-lactamase superfamily II)